jgi:hypothetical protein
LLGDMEAAAVPLHDVVVADSAFVHEAAHALESVRSGPRTALRGVAMDGRVTANALKFAPLHQSSEHSSWKSSTACEPGAS